jgi:hypothetical protein
MAVLFWLQSDSDAKNHNGDTPTNTIEENLYFLRQGVANIGG